MLNLSYFSILPSCVIYLFVRSMLSRKSNQGSPTEPSEMAPAH